MAFAKPGLEKAINDILERHGTNGKRLSYRQAERRTGLSTATISELAKGNARTPESLRRFARAFDEDAARLMLLAGFVPEEEFPHSASPKRDGAASLPVSKQAVSISACEQAVPIPASEQAVPMIPQIDLENTPAPLSADERACLLRLGHALAHLPPGTDRALWTDHLSHTAHLLERFGERKRV